MFAESNYLPWSEIHDCVQWMAYIEQEITLTQMKVIIFEITGDWLEYFSIKFIKFMQCPNVHTKYFYLLKSKIYAVKFAFKQMWSFSAS